MASSPSLAVTLLMLVGARVFVALDWCGRIPLWIPAAIVAGGAAFAAFGAAIGSRRARGPRLVAARVHGLAADRIPLAGPVGDRRRRGSTT